MDVVYSVNGVPIRITEERWQHIIKVRDDLAEYYEDCLDVIEDPDIVVKGYRGSLRAAKGYGKNRFLVVVYKELGTHDGFLITAYFVRKVDRRRVVWRR